MSIRYPLRWSAIEEAHTAIGVATTTDSSWLGVRVRLRVIVLRLSS